MRLTAAIYRVGDGYVARCLETDVVSQGGTVEVARANLVEALELHYDHEDRSEIGAPPVIVPIEVF